MEKAGILKKSGCRQQLLLLAGEVHGQSFHSCDFIHSCLLSSPQQNMYHKAPLFFFLVPLPLLKVQGQLSIWCRNSVILKIKTWAQSSVIYTLLQQGMRFLKPLSTFSDFSFVFCWIFTDINVSLPLFFKAIKGSYNIYSHFCNHSN